VQPDALIRQRGKHIGLLVKPTPLLTRGREHLAHRLPEAQRAITDGQRRGGHAATAAAAQ
jgi:hypothetical protein